MKLKKKKHTHRFVELHRNKRNNIIKHRMKLLVATFAVLFLIIFVFQGFSNNTSAYANDNNKLYYDSVLINNGDSLWSIAEQYTDGSTKEIMNCIREIKRINHMSFSETLKSGSYIVVPYYSADIL